MTHPDTPQAHFVTLDQSAPDENERTLARQFAPRILFDKREPFLPSMVGYTIFRANAASHSFPRHIELTDNAVLCIEYAIWWDWDIQHLYELEHIWVYVDAQETVVRVDASWHGGWHQMLDENGHIPLSNGRVQLHSEPGKHAFAATIAPLLERRPTTDESTGIYAGRGGVWVTPLFAGIIKDRHPLNNRVVQAYLERQRFEPGYEFTKEFSLEDVVFVPWPTAFQWIPQRVHFWVDYLERHIPYNERPIWRIAHRGASAHAQEGSAASIHKAKELGADMVEMDLRFTADDVPVIFHDSSLSRVFGINHLVSDLTLQELKTSTPADKEPVLTFAEMVRLCRELRLAIYLDIKDITLRGMLRVFEIIDAANAMDGCIFASFRADWLADIKAQRPDAITSVLFSSIHDNPVLLAQAVNADYVHPCFERFDDPQQYIAGAWMQQAREAHLGVICWHEERPAVISALYELGVDGICSDEPELLTAEAARVRST